MSVLKSKKARRVAVVLAVVLALVLGVVGVKAVSAAPQAQVNPCHKLGPPGLILKMGSSGQYTRNLQQCMYDVHFEPIGVDGAFGLNTLHAVWAVEKDGGLARDGKVGPAVKALLAKKTVVSMPDECRKVSFCAKKSSQMLYVKAGKSIVAVDASMGANTPIGNATVCVQKPGPDPSREVPGAILDRPAYLNVGDNCTRGIAIHGFGHDVPPWPASRGCIRVTTPVMDVLYPHLGVRKKGKIIA